MGVILNDIKSLVEVDIDDKIYDDQLVLIINSGISYLINNGIPIDEIKTDTNSDEWDKIDKHDYSTILNWLNYHVLQNFDRTLMLSYSANTTNNFIDYHMTDLLYQLKVRYDSNEVN